MSPEPTPTEAWSAVGATLIRSGRTAGHFASREVAEWVAEACNTLAEMDQAQAEWEASDEAPHCAMVDIGDEEMRVQGGADWTEQDRREMGQLVSVVKQRMADANPAKRIEALAFNAVTRALAEADVFVRLTDRQKIASAVLEAVQDEHERQVREEIAKEQAAWLPEILHVAWGFAMREHTGTAQLTPWHAKQALRHVPGAVLDAARVARGER